MQLGDRLAVAGQALLEHLVVHVVGRRHQRHAGHRQLVDGGKDVVGEQCHVLDALAVEPHQELFDLPRALGRFLVQRDADLAVGRGHRLAGEAGVFALDVEVADLAEVEQLLVVLRPERHAPAVDVVREMVHDLQAHAHRMARHAVEPLEVDVVDALAVFEAVDQVQRRAADAFDRRQPQLHRAGGNLDRLRAEFERAGIRLVRILDAERQRAGARPVLGGKVAGQALGLAVDDEVDVALPVQQHVLAAVARDQAEAELLEQRLQHVGRGRRELDELEPHQAHGVVDRIGHARDSRRGAGAT